MGIRLGYLRMFIHFDVGMGVELYEMGREK